MIAPILQMNNIEPILFELFWFDKFSKNALIELLIVLEMC